MRRSVNMGFSKTYLFRECYMLHHTLGLELKKPVVIDGEVCQIVYLQDFDGDEKIHQQLTQDVINKVDLYGTFKAIVFTETSGPFELKKIMLDTENIESVEEVKMA